MSSMLDNISAMNTPLALPDRHALLRDLAALTTMQRGTLAEEYRQQPSRDGKGTVRRGPYYKHQCWEKGRNVSRRVPAPEVPILREDLANAQRFEQITTQLAQLTVTQTRALRTSQAEAARVVDAQTRAGKKNSSKNAARKSSAKPKASTRKPSRASPRKG